MCVSPDDRVHLLELLVPGLTEKRLVGVLGSHVTSRGSFNALPLVKAFLVGFWKNLFVISRRCSCSLRIFIVNDG